MNIDGASVSARIAVLVIETQESNKEVDRRLLDGARHDFADALDEEIQALKEQADDALLGAIFQGVATIGSGGLGVAGATAKCERNWMTPAADALGKLAGPLGEVVSNSYGAANAKSAAGQGQQALWEVEDRRARLNDADAAQNKALAWTSGVVEADAATTNAILSNMA